jgi:hypothetical protein
MNSILISNTLQIRYSDFGGSVGEDAFSYFDEGNVPIYQYRHTSLLIKNSNIPVQQGKTNLAKLPYIIET